MLLRITIAMLEIRNRKTLQSKINVFKSDVKSGTASTAYRVGRVNLGKNPEEITLSK